MHRPIRNVVATRILYRNIPNGKKVTVQVGKPHKVSTEEWECAFHITNIGMHEPQFAHGIDGIQALILAIEGVRVTLERTGDEFTWEGGEESKTGIPRYVPAIYGRGFTEHLHGLIDGELERFAHSAEKRYEASSRQEIMGDKEREQKGQRLTRDRKPPNDS